MPLSPRTLRPSSTFTPKSISGLALWLDGSDTNSLYTTDAGAVTAVSSPTEISGCVGWWDASDLSSMRQNSDGTGTVAAGDPVGWWKDKSATGANVTGSGSARPTVSATGFNSRTALAFNGSSTNLSNASYTALNSLSGFTVIAVCANSGGTANLSRVYPAGFQGFWMNGGRRFYVDDSANYALTGTPGSNVLAAGIYSFRFASSAIENYESGSLNTPTIAGTIPSSTGSSASAAIHIGSNIGANAFWNGPIAEYILFNRALTRTELARVEAYLAAKWGISGVHANAADEATAVSSPLSVPGCVGWWDASDAESITQSGGLVSQINDKSGLAAHASQATSGSRPTLVGNALNGRSVLRFDGGDALTGNFASALATGAYSVFAVCKDAALVTNGRVFSVAPAASADFASGSVIPCCTNASTPGQLSAFDGASGTNRGAVSGFSSYAVFSGVVGSSSVVNASNGAKAASASVTFSSSITRFGIGAPAQGGAGGWNGDIAEVIYYSSALSDTDRARVEKYLATKWGISGVPDPTPPVGYWRDRSGNGRHATQSTAASRPTISATALNGRRQLGLVSQHLRGPSTTWAGSVSIYWVGKTGQASNGAIVFGDGTVDQTDGFHAGWLNTQGVGAYGNGWGAGNAPRAESPSAWRNADIVAGVTLSSTESVARVNGATTNTTAALTGSLSQSAAAQFYIGRETNNTWNNISGTLAELLIYQPALNASQRLRVERHLAAKYGITLAPQVSNADAQDWVNRVYANGGTVTSATASAVNTFCDSITNASLRDRFYRLNLFCGTGLNAALVPLYRGPSLGGTQYGNTTDTNVGPFVSGDYAETNGLDGDGVTKYLNTGLSPDGMGVPATVHLAAFKGAGTWTTSREFIGTRDADDLYQLQMRYPASLVPSLSVLVGGSSSIISEVAVSTAASFLIATRSSSSDLFLWQNGTKIATGTTNATTPGACANPYMVFTRNASGTAASSQWEHALRAYSIGLGLNDSQAVAYSTAMQTFQTALGRNV